MPTWRTFQLVNGSAYIQPGEKYRKVLCEKFLSTLTLLIWLISLIYFDDFTKTDTSSVREFHARFVSNRPQMHPLLDYYAELLRDAWNHFLPSCADLVVSSSLDFVTGLIVDYDHQKMILPVLDFFFFIQFIYICISDIYQVLIRFFLGERMCYQLSAMDSNYDGCRDTFCDIYVSTWYSVGHIYSDPSWYGQLY